MEESETFNNFKEEDVKELKDKKDDEEDDITGVEDFNGDGNVHKDTNAGRGPSEWLRFLLPKARTEAFRAMENDKSSLSTYLRKKLKTSKVRLK